MTAEEKCVQKYERFTAALGPQSGLFWFGAGLSLDNAKRLASTAFGRRLERWDEHGEIDFFALAGVLHLTGDELGTRVGMGSVPPADRTERNFSHWKVATLAAWAAGGCPGRGGRPQPELAAAIGADGPAPAREMSNGERIAAGIRFAGR